MPIQSPPVADRTKREHLGMVDKVIWSSRDPDQPCSIIALTDTRVVVVDAPPESFTRGQRYRFLGKWEETTRGPRFRAETYIHDTPHTKAGVVKYLSEVCGGVGQRTAEKLWQEFDSEAVRVLREEPERVAAAGIMSEDAAREAARDLQGFAGNEQTRVDLFGLFTGRGFSKKLVGEAIRKWGARAPEVIRKDPYKLLTSKLPSCGFKRCDQLYLELGGRPAALKRQALAGWNALAEDRTGSTWLQAPVVASAIKAAVPASADPVKAIKLGIRAGVFRILREGSRRWIAHAEHARQESSIASAVRSMQAGPCLWPTDLPVTMVEGDGLPSQHQAEQIRRALSSSIGLFGGGPGTGKTHVLSFVLKEIRRLGLGSVAVCAPTGKAAIRAKESLQARGIHGVQVSTIHRLLWKVSPEKPLPFDFLVVDESSMIGVDLMARLLEACRIPHLIPGQPERVIQSAADPDPVCRRCGRVLTNPESWEIGYGPECAKHVDPSQYSPVARREAETVIVAPTEPIHAAGTHILFVGDPYQLAPVSHGAPFRDMIAAGLAYGELTETRRNAGQIVRACASIKAGSRPEMAERFDLDAPDPINLKFIGCRQDETLEVIEQTLRAMSKFDPVWDTQVIVATNDSRKSVNTNLGNVLNPDGRRVKEIPFAVGDKVICLKNSELTPSSPLKGRGGSIPDDSGYWQQERDGVAFFANGEIARVAAVGTAGMVVVSGEKAAWVPKSRPRNDDAEEGEASNGGAMGDWDLAWAITGHKSQGSEWPVAIIVAEKAGTGVADRNWWYTAVSRASKACLIVGDLSAFYTQSRRASLNLRKTFLAELIGQGDESDHAGESPPDAESSS